MVFGPTTAGRRCTGVIVTLAALAATVAGSRPLRAAEATLAPGANVSLRIDPPTTRGTWTMRVTNDGDVPVMLAADARLLTFDVTLRGAKMSVHCELPPDMRPDDDLERPLVLPPHRSYSEKFEPRLYCLDGRKLDALAPGAIVVARLGWKGRGTGAPLIVAPIDGVEPKLAPSKAVTAPPVALPDEETPAPATEPSIPDSSGIGGAKLALTSGPVVDSATPSEIAIPVSLRNDGSRSVVVRFRPETLAFDVTGPRGTDHCAWPVLAAAPTREAFTTLAPRGRVDLTVLLSAYCTGTTGPALDRSGLLVVRASFDTRRASGESIGLRTFDGQVVATTPTTIRLRRGFVARGLTRPKLDPKTEP